MFTNGFIYMVINQEWPPEISQKPFVLEREKFLYKIGHSKTLKSIYNVVFCR